MMFYSNMSSSHSTYTMAHEKRRQRQSHSCVEKAAMIGFVKLRILDTDEKFQLRGATLAAAIDVSRP